MNSSMILKMFCAILLLLLFSCNGPTAVAGGATTVESPYVLLVVLDENNRPVENAAVELMPSNFDPCEDSHGKIRKRFSNRDGEVQFDSISDEEFSAIIRSGTQGGYTASLHKGDTTSVTLRAVSAVTVPLSKSEPVRFLGTSLVGVYDSSAKSSRFDAVPAGLYKSLLIGDSSAVIIDSVQVDPGAEQIVDIQNPEFSIETVDAPQALILGVPLQISASDSRIWVGTRGAGLWFRDSIGWHQVDLSSAELAPFRNIPIKKLACSGAVPSGMSSEITAAVTDSGTLLYKNGTWVHLETEYLPAQKGVHISSISADSSGMILIAYDNSLYRFISSENVWRSEADLVGASYVLAGVPAYFGFSNGTIKRVSDFGSISTGIMGVKGGWPINDLCTAESGTLYAGVQTGLFRISDTQNEQVLSTAVPVVEIESGPSEMIWVLSSDGLISTLAGDSNHELRSFSGVFRSSDISTDRTGALYACGSNGIVKITHR